MIDREKNEGNELKDNMSVSGQNEINFSDLEMQKTGFYYNQQQSFNSYYPAESGYCFDGVPTNAGSYGEPSPSPPGGDYFPTGQQCAMPVGSNPVQNGDMSPGHYDQYSSQCVQNLTCNQTIGSASPSTGSMKKEIYPWMKDSRQNSKRQQQQQQQQQQQPAAQQQQQQTPSAAASSQSQPSATATQQSPSQQQNLGGKSTFQHFRRKSQTLPDADGVFTSY